jgi:hypothetical protein
LQAVEHVIE